MLAYFTRLIGQPPCAVYSQDINHTLLPMHLSRTRAPAFFQRRTLSIREMARANTRVHVREDVLRACARALQQQARHAAAPPPTLINIQSSSTSVARCLHDKSR